MAGLLDLISNSIAMKRARDQKKHDNLMSQLRINLGAWMNPTNEQESMDARSNIDTLAAELIGPGYHKEHRDGVLGGLHSVGDAILGAFGMQLPQGKLPQTPAGLMTDRPDQSVTSNIRGYDMPHAYPSDLAGGGGPEGATPATLSGMQTAPGWPPSAPGLQALQSMDAFADTPKSGADALDAVKPLEGTPGPPGVPMAKGAGAPRLMPLTQAGLTSGRLGVLEAKGQLGGEQGQAIEQLVETLQQGIRRGDISLPDAKQRLKDALLNKTPETGGGTLEEARRAEEWIKSGDPYKVAAGQAWLDKFGMTGEARKEKEAATKEQEANADQVADGIYNGDLSPILTGRDSKTLYRIQANLHKRGFDLQAAQNDARALQRFQASANSAQQLRLRQGINFAVESLDQLDNPQNPGEDLIGKLRNAVPRTKFPVINRAALTAAKNGVFGQQAAEAATLLESQIKDLQSELAVVFMGGNSPTDRGLEQAQGMLQSDWSDQTLRRAIDLARRNLRIRVNSISNTMPAGMSQQGIQQYQREGVIGGGAPGGNAAPAIGGGGAANPNDPLGVLQ